MAQKEDVEHTIIVLELNKNSVIGYSCASLKPYIVQFPESDSPNIGDVVSFITEGYRDSKIIPKTSSIEIKERSEFTNFDNGIYFDTKLTCSANPKHRTYNCRIAFSSEFGFVSLENAEIERSVVYHGRIRYKGFVDGDFEPLFAVSSELERHADIAEDYGFLENLQRYEESYANHLKNTFGSTTMPAPPSGSRLAVKSIMPKYKRNKMGRDNPAVCVEINEYKTLVVTDQFPSNRYGVHGTAVCEIGECDIAIGVAKAANLDLKLGDWFKGFVMFFERTQSFRIERVEGKLEINLTFRTDGNSFYIRNELDLRETDASPRENFVVLNDALLSNVVVPRGFFGEFGKREFAARNSVRLGDDLEIAIGEINRKFGCNHEVTQIIGRKSLSCGRQVENIAETVATVDLRAPIKTFGKWSCIAFSSPEIGDVIAPDMIVCENAYPIENVIDRWRNKKEAENMVCYCRYVYGSVGDVGNEAFHWVISKIVSPFANFAYNQAESVMESRMRDFSQSPNVNENRGNQKIVDAPNSTSSSCEGVKRDNERLVDELVEMRNQLRRLKLENAEFLKYTMSEKASTSSHNKSKTLNSPNEGGSSSKAKSLSGKKEPAMGDPTTSKTQRKQKGSVAARMQQQQDGQTPKRVRKTSTPAFKSRVPVDVLDDLEFRFISNIPTFDKKNRIRICFQVELAHWFYIDHIVEGENNKNCPNLSFRDFARALFEHCTELRHLANNVDSVISQWREYKSTVPTYGAILLDETLQKVLLVKSYFAKGNSWGFPKGKVNQNEPPRDCAIRETLEETGFDFSTISEKEKKVQKFINDAMVRLYIVPNVPTEFQFGPQTRKEIKDIKWFNICDLPTEKGEIPVPHLAGYNFFMVIPFVHEIQKFSEKELQKRQKAEKAKQQAETSSILANLFGNAEKSSPSSMQTPVLKRLTSEEFFSSIRKSVDQKIEEDKKMREESAHVARPTLPEFNPTCEGFDPLGTLGVCTPLKPGASLNIFGPSTMPPAASCPTIDETDAVNEASTNRDGSSSTCCRSIFSPPAARDYELNSDALPPITGSSSEISWHDDDNDVKTPVPTEIHHGWLDSKLANSIMQHVPPMPQTPTTSPNAQANRSLSHLISKPIQPQPIAAVPATASALGSAEAPKRSSRISLSDNSAFTAINGRNVKPHDFELFKMLEISARSASQTPQMRHRENQNSLISPTSSGMSSVMKSMIELTAIESSVLSPNQMNQIGVPASIRWSFPFKLDINYILGPIEQWKSAFSMKASMA
ncbi:unnamed protein product [Caenorhabditis bovis]|uniref:mRNA-decapping enzyme 2 n=1 Tax=Caenorhabditis bovis TaxID=2654633 RepID=A0A8S1ESP1_9PELO|nr:unnamed protein product [Caenorhabditis bovis]